MGKKGGWKGQLVLNRASQVLRASPVTAETSAQQSDQYRRTKTKIMLKHYRIFHIDFT
jgi:hypothetical protein